MMNWHIVDSNTFALGTKVEEDLYFISDTHEIYRGNVPFTESVVLYTTEPTVKALNRLYVNSTTLEGKIWNGTAWKTVINPVSDTVAADGKTPVSGTAVAAYVAAELASLKASADIISTLSWDSVEHLLEITKGDGSSTTVLFDGLGTGLTASAVDGKTRVQMTDASGNAIGTYVDLDLERFVTGAEYDTAAKSIILYFDGKTGAASTDKITIPVGDLVDTYTVESTSSIAMSMAKNVISGTVKISSEAGNAIVLKTDGIYVAPVDLSDMMTLVPNATEGHLATLDASGQVIDSGKSIDEVGTTQIFTGTGTIEEAVGGATLRQGAICILKAKIGTSDKYEYTGYVYNGTAWEAMDGNYNAENVYFAQDLTTTSAIGNITLNNGQATIPAAGKNLKQVFDTIFVKEKNPSVTQPSASISAPQNKAYEVGTSVTPSYSATLNAGSYQYGPATGITATSWAITDTASHSATTNAGSFDAFTVEDATNYKITATATYGDGAIPVTNVGNPYAAGQIKGGTKTATSGAVTGYRCGFYGTLTSKDGAINSALVRSLTGKTTATPAAGNNWSVAIPVGAQRVVFAYPATVRDVNSVLDVNGLGAEIKSAFTQYTVDVEGANGFTAKSYKVYVLDYAAPNDKANTYTVKL